MNSQSKAPTVDTSPLSRLAYEMLSHVGENPTREGLLRTPERFEKALSELTSGYKLSALDAIGDGIFDSEGSNLVSVKDIEFFSLCEHHMLPFWGSVSISYYPSNKILGLSKLARVVDVFAKRLQVQERLTQEVALAISEAIDAKAVFVKVQGQHMCMMMRGVKKVSSSTVTEYGVNIEKLNSDEKKRIWKALDQ
jgi:GTP cyclohydrolase IA